MAVNEEQSLTYDTRNCDDRLSAVGGFVKRWKQYCGHGAVLRVDLATYVGMRFLCCKEDEAYASGSI